MRYGYKASAEQFGTRELVDLSLRAEALGLDTIAVSDHFQPWRHNGGHAPAALPWLGASSRDGAQGALLGTSVLTPTLRYHPSIVAQSFATLARLARGPVFLGVGTGEAMNETPATGAAWPGAKERRLRLAEAIKLIRRLWTEERVDFEGEYYRTVRATVYERPESPPPIYVAASGPLAAKLVGRAADGFICTSGKPPELYESLLRTSREGAAPPVATPARSPHDRDQGLLRHRRRARRARLPLVGCARPDRRGEDRDRGPARARAARRRASGARRLALHRVDRPRRGRRADRAVRRARLQASWCSTALATTSAGFSTCSRATCFRGCGRGSVSPGAPG